MIPLRCTRLCPHALDKEDGVERQGPVTLNPRHMRKAFKVMNELRRWWSSLLSRNPRTMWVLLLNLSISYMPIQPELAVWRDHSGRGCRDRCSQGGSGCWQSLLPCYVHRWGPVSCLDIVVRPSCFVLCGNGCLTLVNLQVRWQRAGRNEWG